MTERDKKLVRDIACQFHTDEYEAFLTEIGWMDWMSEFKQNQNDPDLSEKEADMIEKTLKHEFNMAHKIAD